MKTRAVVSGIALFSVIFLGNVAAMENPDLEGWIVRIDKGQGTIRVLSAHNDGSKLPHDRVVPVKPGYINDYNLNDYVQVKFRDDLPYALLIEKAPVPVGQNAPAPSAAENNG